MRLGYPSIKVHDRKDSGQEITIAVQHIANVNQETELGTAPRRATIVTVAPSVIKTTETYEEVLLKIARA